MKRVVTLALLPFAAGCAWSNPDSRPVWNAFEHTLVPDGATAFYASLPLTAPLGLLAIVVDSLVAHPLQVVDDAGNDALELWRHGNVDYDEAYYTEMAFTVPRAAVTPVVFTVSWLGRSLFDIPPHFTDEQRAAAAARVEQEEQARIVDELRAWLDSGCLGTGGVPVVDEWRAELEPSMRRALAGNAVTRRRLHRTMLAQGRLVFGPYRAEAGLLDEDPVVRWSTIQSWDRSLPEPSAAVLERLRRDPAESVRLAARDRFPAR